MTEYRPTTLYWRETNTEADRAANARTVVAIDDLIDQQCRKEVVAILERWSPSAILACFAQLRGKRARKLLKWMPEDLSFRLLSEIDPHFHETLFADETRERFRQVLARMDADKAARLLLSLPRDYATLIVEAHPDAENLRAVLADDDSAQAAMKRGAVVARSGQTVADLIETIRARDAQIEKIDSLHVVDEAGRLTGFLKLRDLILNDRDKSVADIARPDPLKVTRDTDREEVLKLAKKRKTSVIAVVDEDDVLVGVIAPKELAEIARREAEEDMLLMGGVSPASTAQDRPLLIVQRRLPWLVTGLIGSAIAATVIGSFETALAAATILAAFIPIVMATAGNAGMQAASVSIQAIASDSVPAGGLRRRVLRELQGAALNGGLLGTGVASLVVALSAVVGIERAPLLAATVALSILTVVSLASFVGAVMPFVLRAAKQDPAAATGVFVLGSNDVFGVLVYFTIASALYI